MRRQIIMERPLTPESQFYSDRPELPIPVSRATSYTVTRLDTHTEPKPVNAGKLDMSKVERLARKKGVWIDD